MCAQSSKRGALSILQVVVLYRELHPVHGSFGIEFGTELIEAHEGSRGQYSIAIGSTICASPVAAECPGRRSVPFRGATVGHRSTAPCIHVSRRAKLAKLLNDFGLSMGAGPFHLLLAAVKSLEMQPD